MQYDLFFGDCLMIMRSLIENNIKVDAIITDPPYGTTKCKWDNIIPFDDMWSMLNNIKKDKHSPIILFGNEPFSSNLRLSNIKNYKYDIYWQKERLTNVAQVKKRVGKTIENIMVFYEKQCYYNPQKIEYKGKLRKNKVKNGKLGKLIDSNVKNVKEYKDDGTRFPIDLWKFNRDILTCNIHPTQKPVKLMEELLLTYTKEGDTILDFTCGSGSTGVACKLLNRNFIGIDNGFCKKEKSKFYEWKWIDITKYRINNEKLD